MPDLQVEPNANERDVLAKLAFDAYTVST